MRARAHAFLRTLIAMLREIFDESAYERFLRRREMASSATAYAEFIHETEHASARRHRCC